VKLFKLPLFEKRQDQGKTNQNSHTSQFENGQNRTGLGAHPQAVDLAHQLSLFRIESDSSRKLISILHPQSLFDQAVILILEAFNLYYVGIFLADETDKKVLLKAGSGEMGRRMLINKFFLPMADTSIIGWVTINRKPYISFDLNNDPLYIENPDLPLSRSEIVLPLLSREEMIGVVTLQSSQPNYFHDEDIFIFQSLADNFVVALKNAEEFQKSQADLNEISTLYRKSILQTWSEVTAHTEGLSSTFDNPESSIHQVSPNSIQMPLTLRDQLIGQITLEMGQDPLSPEELAFVDTISIQTSLALENARLLEETQRQVSREQLLNRISNHFSRAVNIEEILKTVLQEIGRMPFVSEASVFLTQASDLNQSDDEKLKAPLS
jgi:GAF domain-containing protein